MAEPTNIYEGPDRRRSNRRDEDVQRDRLTKAALQLSDKAQHISGALQLINRYEAKPFRKAAAIVIVFAFLTFSVVVGTATFLVGRSNVNSPRVERIEQCVVPPQPGSIPHPCYQERLDDIAGASVAPSR